jgi:hypothetical protein
MLLVNAYATHRDPPAPAFPHRLRGRRDASDPELAKHLQGFKGFVMDRGKRPMTATRYAVLRHLERVKHHLSLEVEDGDMNAFASWARDVNALVFLPDGSVRAPDGKVLVAPGTGEPQAGAEVPYPEDAARRKASSTAALSSRGIATPKSLPPVVAEIEVDLLRPGDVAKRAFALLACAVRGESLASGDPIEAAQLERQLPLAFPALSPKERAFMENPVPGDQDVTNQVWRYEALATLAWSLGVVDALPFPAAICDVSALTKAMLALDARSFASSARLRAPSEILDQLDLVFRLHWATTEARVRKKAPPAGVEPGVVAERHYALNWLTRFEGAEWDDVTTPT